MASVQTPNNGYENHFLLATIEKLYLETEIADVYFVFGEKDNCERVPAHKWLLAAGSDVFKAMFYGDLKEKGDVEITDASADAFKEFLQFFYRGKVTLTVENAFDVVNLCRKYDIAACLNICDRFFEDELTRCNDSVCSAYGLAIFFEREDLKKLCESNIVQNTEAVFDSASFLECDRSVLSRILEFDEFFSCSEVNVFEACMNWVKAKAQTEEVTRELVQAHLGDLFYEIRFGSMSLEDFVDLTPSYGKVFSFDEHQDILQMIRSEDFQPKMFKKERRQVYIRTADLQWTDDAVIEWDRINGKRSGVFSSRPVEKTTFTANKPVLVGEIKCMTLCNRSEDGLRAEMTVFVSSNRGAPKVLYNNKNVVFYYREFSEVTLPKPILIKPGLIYEIQLKHSSAIMFDACTLASEFQLPGTDIIIKFIGENSDRGFVCRIDFNLISNA